LESKYCAGFDSQPSSSVPSVRQFRLGLKSEPTMQWLRNFGEWCRNIWVAVSTLVLGMWVTMRTMLWTYKRKTFTEVFQYPEVPVPVKARYRGFHRFDLTTCIGCEKCAVACPRDRIFLSKV